MATHAYRREVLPSFHRFKFIRCALAIHQATVLRTRSSSFSLFSSFLVHCNTRSSVAQNTTLVMIYKSQCFVCGFSINNRMCSKLYTGFATGMFNIEAHIAHTGSTRVLHRDGSIVGSTGIYFGCGSACPGSGVTCSTSHANDSHHCISCLSFSFAFGFNALKLFPDNSHICKVPANYVGTQSAGMGGNTCDSLVDFYSRPVGDSTDPSAGSLLGIDFSSAYTCVVISTIH